MNRILFISNFSGNISFSDISLDILRLLKNKINEENTEFFIFSIGTIRKMITYDIPKETGIDKNNIFVINDIKNLNNNFFNLEYYKNYINGYNSIGDIIKKINPNLIFIFNDNSAVNNMVNAINNIRPKYKGKIAIYVPIDIGNFDKNIINTNCDLIFVPTDFTKDILMKYEKNVPIVKLPHFIKSSYFYKINDDDELLQIREKYIGIENINKFVIGAINANSIRKRWDILLKGFCKYYNSNETNKPILFIKTTAIKANNPVYGHGRGFNLDDLIKEICAEYNVPIDSIILKNDKYSKQELNEIYNMCDLFINTTDGEGFGMTPFESGLAEKVTILPNYSAFESIYENFEPSDEYQPNFLLPVNLYPAKIIRDNNNITNILDVNQYYCIYYSCKHYEKSPVVIHNEFLPISKNIKTIIISNLGSDTEIIDINPVNGVDLFIHLKTMKRALQLLKQLDNDKISEEIQILISCAPNILDETYESMCIFECDLTNFNSINRKIYISNKILLLEYGIKNAPHVGLVEVDDIVDKINFYEQNRDILKIDGENIAKFVKSELNEDIFYDIFDESLKELNIYL